jgi:hypothetical protein
MIVAVHQPQYLPWLGYFDKMDRADVFCYLDNVQYKKNEWQNRNRIRTAQGWQWLTVPVTYRFPEKINEVRINNRERWGKKHLNAIRSNYGKAPFFSQYFGFFENLYQQEWEHISELNIRLTEGLRGFLGIREVQTVRASGLELGEDPTGRLVDVCRTLGANTYLSGADGTKYMDMTQFEKAGIRVVVQEFQHPTYSQVYPGFESHMSVADLLFNCGPKAIDVIRQKLSYSRMKNS